MDFNSQVALYKQRHSDKLNMFYLPLPLQIVILARDKSVIWPERNWYKNFCYSSVCLSVIGASKCFRLTNFTTTLLSCPLLLLERVRDSSQYLLHPPLLRFFTNTDHCTLQIIIRMLFGMPDISMLFLLLYSCDFACFFSLQIHGWCLVQ